MAIPPAILYGDGIAAADKDRVAHRYSMHVAPGGSRPNGHDCVNIVLLNKSDIDDIHAYASQSYDAYIEMIDGDEEPLSANLRHALEQGMMIFSFATSTIYSIDGAGMVCDALAARGILSAIRRPDVELSLHESISNAVVHGNLGLSSSVKAGPTGYAEFAQALQQKMQTSSANKRVNILCKWDSEFLDISVCDLGNGFDENKILPNTDPFAPAGRGLSIMRSLTLAMTITDGGRTTTLRFLT